VKWKGRGSEEGKNYSLHSALLSVLHLVTAACSEKERRRRWQSAKVPGGKKSKSGGSDPTFWVFSRPKSFGVAPALGTVPGAAYFPLGHKSSGIEA
jgi:hypothetical protein